MLLDGETEVTSTSTETVEPTTTTEPENNGGNPEENNPTPQDRTFTRDEVTTIVKKRIERAINKLLEKFGIENKDKIQEYLDSHNKSLKDLEEMTGKYNDLDSKYKSQMREYLYLKNNIIPEKYDDLDKNFVDGLTEEKLLEVIKNHPEFVKPKVTIPEKIGQGKEGEGKGGITEKEYAEKIFGVKF